MTLFNVSQYCSRRFPVLSMLIVIVVQHALAQMNELGDGQGSNLSENLPSAEQVATLSAPALLAGASAGFLSVGALGTSGEGAVLPRISHDVAVFRVRYRAPAGCRASVDPTAKTPLAKNGTVLSGLLALPMTSGSAKNVDTVAFLHGTVSHASSVPSRTFEGRRCGSGSTGWAAITEALDCIDLLKSSGFAGPGVIVASAMGFATIAPDGYGLGDDASNNAIPYLVAAGYACSTAGLHAAAVQLAETLVPGLSLSSAVIPAGYSEGGYAALAVHAMSQRNWDAGDGIRAPWVPLSLPSAGPYDLLLQSQRSLAVGDYEVPAYLAFVGAAYNSFYGENPFATGLADTVSGWFDGSNSISDINHLVTSLVGADPRALFCESTVTELTTGDPTSVLVAELKDNTVANGWTPNHGSRVHLCHGMADTVVHPVNAEAAMTTLANTTYTPVASNVCGSHTDCGAPCLVDTLVKLAEFKSVPDPRPPVTGNSARLRVCSGCRRGGRPM